MRVVAKCAGRQVAIAVKAEEAVSVGASLFPLFAFERMAAPGVTKKSRERLSLESGLLCPDTAFVGVSEKRYCLQRECDSDVLYGRVPYGQQADGASYGLYGQPLSSSRAYGDERASYRLYSLPPAVRAAFRERPEEIRNYDYPREKVRYGFHEEREPASGRGGAGAQRCTGPARDDRQPRNRWADEDGGYHALIREQSIDGSWQSLDDVLRVARIEGQTDWAAGLQLSPAVIATVVAVAWLRVKASARMDAWRLVERKALSWLSAEGVGDVEALIARAMAEL